MDIIYWLIPLTIIILIIAVLLFFWAVKDGQFDDLDSPAVNILLDDDIPKPIQSDQVQSNSVPLKSVQSNPDQSSSIHNNPQKKRKNEPSK